MQFVGIRFKSSRDRVWTYHHLGEPVAVGDVVEVLTPRDGKVTTEVVQVSDVAPTFRTKPIERVVSRQAPPDDAAHPAPAHSPPDDDATPPIHQTASGGETRST